MKTKKLKGNICIDMLTAAMNHYSKSLPPVDSITLCPLYWVLFLDYVGERSPELYSDAKLAGEMNFRNVKIRKGSSVMIDRMKIEFKKLVAEA
jgi:hypothetical protein